ncbi:MAG: hypothetical protein ACLSFJ_02385 [Holdemania filiformis]
MLKPKMKFAEAQDCQAAAWGGRIELNSALALGGRRRRWRIDRGERP